MWRVADNPANADYLDRHGLQPAEQGESVKRVLRRIRRYDVAEIADWLESGDLDRDED